MNSLYDIKLIFLHKWLKRPFILKPVIDIGSGSPIIFLHGIGRTNIVWQNVINKIDTTNHRTIAFDLLGFGSSPKPNWLKYDVFDHANTIIKSIDDLKLNEPTVLVGHSMGCLIALKIARLRPDLVKHLILYEMPLYEGLPEKRIYRLRLNLYTKFYNWLVKYKPSFNEKIKKSEQIGRKVIGFEVTESTWIPFVKSLENTILNQSASEDIENIEMPIDAIYGSLDILVIKGHTKKILSDSNQKISHHSIKTRHSISTKAANFIVNRITSALYPQTSE